MNPSAPVLPVEPALPVEPVLPVVIVDAANVVGSVPDGWWRDRRGATERLRDRLAPLSHTGIAGVPGPIRIVLVTEGQARGVAPIPGVEVIDAPGVGDDAIVEFVSSITDPRGESGPADADLTDRDVTDRPSTSPTVVTADRELRSRVTALGALVTGPTSIPR